MWFGKQTQISNENVYKYLTAYIMVNNHAINTKKPVSILCFRKSLFEKRQNIKAQ